MPMIVEGNKQKENESLYRLGNIYGATGGNFAGWVYDKKGIAPTLNTDGGGGRQPMIVDQFNGEAFMDKCEKCVAKERCASKYTFSAWCKNMDKFRIFGKTFKESEKILKMSVI